MGLLGTFFRRQRRSATRLIFFLTNIKTMNLTTRILGSLFILFGSLTAYAQNSAGKEQNDSEKPTKYAMPLYLDLPAEMDVEKGYQEMNVLAGFTDYKANSTFRTIVEYAFAPAKRLAFEVELPFSFEHNKEVDGIETGEAENRLEGFKFGGMYTFSVIPQQKLALSAGFFNELEATPFKDFGHPLFEGNIFQPFIGGAKVWGENFHTLLYTGPSIRTAFEEKETVTDWKINTNLSYRFGKKENYAGVEINQTAFKGGYFETILRPQVHISFTPQVVLGVGATIAAKSEGMNGGGFFRLIYMPGIK